MLPNKDFNLNCPPFVIAGEPQPLLIRPGTSEFFNPTGRYGIITLNENQQIELYCSNGFASPAGTTGNSVTATCSTGNQFTFNNGRYNFYQFVCQSYPAHSARKTGARCYNNGYELEIGFVVATRFLRIMTVCHDEVREETYYAKYQLLPANDGFQTGN